MCIRDRRSAVTASARATAGRDLQLASAGVLTLSAGCKAEATAKKAGATPPTKRRGRAILVPAVICRTATHCSKLKLCTVPTVLRYRTYLVRERNLLALPTLDMYLPLSKFESIQRVSLTLRCNNNLL